MWHAQRKFYALLITYYWITFHLIEYSHPLDIIPEFMISKSEIWRLRSNRIESSVILLFWVQTYLTLVKDFSKVCLSCRVRIYLCFEYFLIYYYFQYYLTGLSKNFLQKYVVHGMISSTLRMHEVLRNCNFQNFLPKITLVSIWPFLCNMPPVKVHVLLLYLWDAT